MGCRRRARTGHLPTQRLTDSAFSQRTVARGVFSYKRRNVLNMCSMKRFGVPALLLTILGSVALSQLIACDDTKASAPPAASPANPASAGTVPAEPPARHGGGW
jgi:hypothetical protein